ncbi:MAG: RIP metalloprotease RseP [Magnetovibrio sp.]|nr:RIP metalloprotease RseP [Magnetovibrio sp.]|tara:strand:+ start:364 stop:1500 length:1137 start_codon:yes stop_codon:yes gene_type:complete
MGLLNFTWYYIIVFLFVLTVLIYVHEWGHYWVARRNGVRVEVFSIGFGPEVFGWTNEMGTRWKIGLIPLGGYVKMFGEDPTTEENSSHDRLTDEELKVSFNQKSLAQRSSIVAAGPIVNFVFAILIFAALAMFEGTPKPLAVLGEIIPNTAASEAGFKNEDRIIAINDKEIMFFSELREIVIANPGKELQFHILRDEHPITLTGVPKFSEYHDNTGIKKTIGVLGVRPSPKHFLYERHNPFMALWIGLNQTTTLTLNILSYIGDMITGNKTADDLGGPLRIAQISGEMAKGGLTKLIFLMAMLSVNLGLINLFPIPMLDGGHLAFYAVEAIRGKPLSTQAQEYSFRLGLILVLVLVIFVTWNDLVHLRVFDIIKDLFT